MLAIAELFIFDCLVTHRDLHLSIGRQRRRSIRDRYCAALLRLGHRERVPSVWVGVVGKHIAGRGGRSCRGCHRVLRRSGCVVRAVDGDGQASPTAAGRGQGVGDAVEEAFRQAAACLQGVDGGVVGVHRVGLRGHLSEGQGTLRARPGAGM